MAAKKSGIKKLRDQFIDMVSSLWKEVCKNISTKKFLISLFSGLGILCILWVWLIVEILNIGYVIGSGALKAVLKK
ncbi:MAG: hypothetical protein WDK96_01190 [Candidatus Paceibacterota bacterium]|jgi:hypothetical protein